MTAFRAAILHKPTSPHIADVRIVSSTYVNDSRERAHPDGFARGTLTGAAEVSLITVSSPLGRPFAGPAPLLAPLPTSEFDATSLAPTSRCISSFCCSKSSRSSRRACGQSGARSKLEGLSGVWGSCVAGVR